MLRLGTVDIEDVGGYARASKCIKNLDLLFKAKPNGLANIW